MKRLIILTTLSLICVSPVYSSGPLFYVRLTKGQAQAAIQNGIDQLFGKSTNRFTEYTEPIIHSSTGDIYWKVEDVHKKSGKYIVRKWFINTKPAFKRYTQDELNTIFDYEANI